MVIEKKSLEVLKQQKKSFINFIKTKNKYSGIIADLFYDDEIEDVDTIQGVRDYLEHKWIQKEVIDSLEGDYTSYLRAQGYYWSVDDSIWVKESIKKNDDTLNKIKKDILKDYRQKEDFFTLDVNKFINEWFDFFNKEMNHKYIWDDIKELENENDKLSKDIRELEYKLYKTGFFRLSLKTKLKGEIETKKHEYRNIEQEIKKKELWSQKIKSIKSDIRIFVWWEECWSSMEACKRSMLRIKEELEEIIDYIPKETINEIKWCIEEYIYKWRKSHKQKMIEKVNKYLNYFYFWEDKNERIVSMEISYNPDKNGINHYQEEFWFHENIPTIYSKNRIDLNIVWVISGLWLNIDGIDKFEYGLIDHNFMDDVFIHTTWFDVLDEILVEWWLISTNEARRRGKNNYDIEKSITQKHAEHKDIYFSRGVRKNWYWWYKKSDDDFVFIANTMTNFANNWYWVPLNSRMQPNAWLIDVNADHDGNWYSIISKSALEKNSWGDNKYSYSKIDVKHFYIFVCETKRSEIESNPKYKTQNANIIYFPEEYKWIMSYKLYEFIKNEIALKDKEKGKKIPIPSKIITSKDGIESINNGYRWAFSDSLWSAPEVLFNPLRNWDIEAILTFIKKNQFVLWFSYLKRFSNFEIDFPRLENFLFEQRSNIDNFESPFDYPRELLWITVLCIKIWLWSPRDANKMSCLGRIKNKLQEFGYTARDLWILCKSVERISYITEFKNYGFMGDVNRRKEYCSAIKKRCDDWLVDFGDMRDFLIKISNISSSSYVCNLMKQILQ